MNRQTISRVLIAVAFAVAQSPCTSSSGKSDKILYVPREHSTIQKAVNAVPPTGKDFVIRIKEGVYHENVVIDAKLKMVGRGKVVIQGAPGSSTITSTTPVTLKNLTIYGGGGASAVNLALEGGQSLLHDVAIVGGAPAAVEGLWSGADLTDEDGLALVKCRIRDATNGLLLGAAPSIGLKTVTFTGVERDALKTWWAGTVHVEGSRFTDVGGDAIRLHDTQTEVFVHNCDMTRIGGGTLVVEGETPVAITMTRNRIRDVAFVVEATMASQLELTKNDARNVSGNALSVRDTHLGTIRGNRLRDVRGNGVELVSSPDGSAMLTLRVERNRIRATGGTAIVLDGPSTALLHNKIGVSTAGIRVTTPDHLLVGNRIQDVGGDAILVQSSGNLLYQSRIKRAGGHGVRLEAGGNQLRMNRVTGSRLFDLSDQSPTPNTYHANEFASVDPSGWPL